MEPCSVKPKRFSCLDKSLNKNDIMPQNKLKQKVELLTKTVKQLIEDFIKLDSMARGTLTAFQLHIGEEDWKKVLKELQERESEAQKENKPEEKKLEL
jgi:hypothetical protein